MNKQTVVILKECISIPSEGHILGTLSFDTTPETNDKWPDHKRRSELVLGKDGITRFDELTKTVQVFFGTAEDPEAILVSIPIDNILCTWTTEHKE